MPRTYLPRSWVNPKLVTGQSAINGTGVFAQTTQSKRRKADGVRSAAMLPREQALSGDYRIRSIWPVAQDMFIALPLSDDLLSLDEYLNHSCDANAWLDDEVTLTAKRDISRGEEITLDQGTWNIDDPYVEDRDPCSCGSLRCRGMLTEGDWQLAEVQTRYEGHFHPMIRHLMQGRDRET
jgi:hypothetical protein